MAHGFLLDASDAGAEQSGGFQRTTDVRLEAAAGCNEKKWLRETVVQHCELSGRMLGDLCVIALFKIALYAPCPLSQIFYRGVVCFFCRSTHGGDNNMVHVDRE